MSLPQNVITVTMVKSDGITAFRITVSSSSPILATQIAYKR